MKSKKEALDDAISATKAAVAEGIVPGGGLALLRCVDAVAGEEDAFAGMRHVSRPRPHWLQPSQQVLDQTDLPSTDNQCRDTQNTDTEADPSHLGNAHAYLLHALGPQTKAGSIGRHGRGVMPENGLHLFFRVC